MSEERIKGGADYPGVSYEDAVEYFAEKIRNRVCELCNNNQWNIQSNSSYQVPGLVLQEINTFNTEGVVPLVLLSCTNCGNTKIFQERVIFNYLKTKRAQSEGGTGNNV